ncbi:AMP-binding protein [Pseudonocardia pini]|uniref:AMP-binding protein n=1 Tax=Pseudonocardia pini TaxID=2758030 RepID=UPI001C68908C|nr:AMP-binding protein [Pseudonocardia pini]
MTTEEPGWATRLASTATNIVEYARFGGLDTGEEPSPFEIAGRGPTHRLRRYFPDTPSGRPPVLLVPPLMLTAEVWDVSPATSAVALLDRAGLEPWVIDFGDPGSEPGGSRRTVTDHVIALSAAIDEVAEQTGRRVHIGGYSQGGLFCYQAAALRACKDVGSIFALGSPFQPLSIPGVDLPEELVKELQGLWTTVLGHTGLPGWAAANLFKWTSPVGAIRGQVQYLAALRDRDSLLPRERQRRFLARDGWITFPGPAIVEVMESMTNERFLRGGLVFGDRTVTLADLTCPILIFTGSQDGFAPAHAVRDIARAAPRAEVYECSLPTGHFGLGVGSRASRVTWPTVGEWAHWQETGGPQPEAVGPVGDTGPAAPTTAAPTLVSALWSVARLAIDAGKAAPSLAGSVSAQVVDSGREIVRVAVEQLPRLARLERIGSHTRVSYGLLLDEAAADRPSATALLLGDTAHTHAAVKEGIDDLVARLLAAGVRRGQHVGVSISSRLRALTTVAALSRVGAVAVLLRPEGDLPREAALGRIESLLADPGVTGVDVPVLEVRAVGPRPSVPDWFTPNPGLGADLGFVLFTGEGAGTRAMPVSNRRWALSAFGAASATALSPADTIYSASPLHHPSGLLLSTAAAVVAGARLALAHGFDPERFWPDVRRCGATVVPYTWAMLSILLRAPEVPEERHHPVRLFVGSGIPRAVWRQALDRFAPARVLELFAVARSNAILANVSGRKVGAAGRSLPGTARTALVALGPSGEPVLDAEGHWLTVGPGEVGMLLAEVDHDQQLWDAVPRRGVFAADDAWLVTGELFRADADGDLWYVGRQDSALPSGTGALHPREVEDALGELPGVGLAVCHRGPGGDVVAAVQAAALTPRALDQAFGALPGPGRPDVVHLVPEIPLTAWFRPDLAALPAPGEAGRVWKRSRAGRYAARRRRTEEGGPAARGQQDPSPRGERARSGGVHDQHVDG